MCMSIGRQNYSTMFVRSGKPSVWLHGSVHKVAAAAAVLQGLAVTAACTVHRERSLRSNEVTARHQLSARFDSL
jgi:hypothetical protein